jgi:glycyl-tRNA synthetase
MAKEAAHAENLMDKIVSLAKRRGFIFPGSEIYGGLQNSWDYGPLGTELKNNIKAEWWKRFVHERTDMVGIDAALIMNPKVWEVSGHLENFSDPMVECRECNNRFRAGQVDVKDPCPSCGKRGTFAEAKMFNLMLKTFLGPAEERASTVYLRPETAQAMFVQFKNVLETTRKRLPFGIAQIGKAFRNEITPGNFIFRTREFELMEIEYFVKEADWEDAFENWQGEMEQWLKDLGVKKEHYEVVEIGEGDRAHYSKRTIDIEYKYPFGQKELYGLAYRGDFDLKNHMEASGEDLRYTDPDNAKDKFLPHVIEPTWGVDRSVLVAMLEAYNEEQIANRKSQGEDGEAEEDTRVVMKFPYWLAPIKVAVLPLSKKEELRNVARPLYEDLVKHFVTEYDETQSIGKRYRRQDEIGTPFCVTVDFESVKDNAVTVRERDSMKQERIEINRLKDYLAKKLT